MQTAAIGIPEPVLSPMFTDAETLVTTGLDDGLGNLLNTGNATPLRVRAGMSPGTAGPHAGSSSGQSFPARPESEIAVTGRGTRGGGALRTSHNVASQRVVQPAGFGTLQASVASGTGNFEYATSQALATGSTALSPVASAAAAFSAADESTPVTPPGASPAYTAQLGFVNGLEGWHVREVGGSAEGKGTVTAGSAVLREGDSFLLTLEHDLTIPVDPVNLSFIYDAWFDTTDPDSINDAFEAALIDADGNPLVHTFVPDRDACFNLTEEMPSALGPGTTEEVVAEGNQVSMDISHLAPGTKATLVFRLVNNDADEDTTVRIESVKLIPPPDDPPAVSIALMNDTAPNEPGNDPYLTDLLTNDPRVAGTTTDDVAVEQLEIQIDDGPFVDITATLRGDDYSFDPGALEPGPHRVTVRATDSLSQTSDSSLNFTMNAPPIPDAGGDRQVAEGASISFDASGSTDSVGHIFSYSWTFHDGTSLDAISATKWYAQDGQARVQMAGEGTGHADQMLRLPATVAPDDTLTIDIESVDGWQTWQRTTSLQDSGPDDPHYILNHEQGTVHFGDGVHGRRPDAGQLIRATYPHALDATFPVSLTVTDTAGSIVMQTVHVTVANLPVDIDTTDDIQGTEGSAVALQVESTDSGILDTHTAEIDWGDGSTSVGQMSGMNGQVTVSDHHTYADNGQYVIVVQITDDGGAAATMEMAAHINNLAPTASFSGPALGNMGMPITFTLSADDPSPVDMQHDFVYGVDWDSDAAVDETIVGPATGLQVQHSYETAGDYTITVTATDKDGDTSFPVADTLTISDEGDCLIGGYVYLDVNNNGVKDAAELALPNVPITLTGDATSTVLTDENGWYEFTDLAPGEYHVTETHPAAFLDGRDTPGEPLFGHCATTCFMRCSSLREPTPDTTTLERWGWFQNLSPKNSSWRPRRMAKSCSLLSRRKWARDGLHFPRLKKVSSLSACLNRLMARRLNSIPHN